MLQVLRIVLLALTVITTALPPSLCPAEVKESPTSSQAKRDAEMFDRAVQSESRSLRIASRAPNEAARQRIAREVSGQLDRNLAKKLMAATGSSLAKVHELHTLLLLVMFTGVHIVMYEIRQAHLEGRSVDPMETAKICKMAAEQLILRFDIYFQMGGAGVVGRTLREPLAFVQRLILQNATRSVLTTFIASGIGSLVTFVGWEIGGQLWDDARNLLEDTRDWQMAQDSWQLTKQVFWSIQDPKNPCLADRRRIFVAVMQNLARILMNDDLLFHDLVSNAWRLRIATGDFVTITAALTAGGVFGSIVAPGAGTLAGMGFSLLGCMAAVLTPQPIKDVMTLGIRLGRFEWNQTGLAMNDLSLWALTDQGSMKSFATTINDATVRAARKALPALYPLAATGLALHSWSGPVGATVSLLGRIVAPRESAGHPYALLDLLEEERGWIYDDAAETLRLTLPRALENRRKLRERIVTIFFETYYLFKLRIQEAREEIETATQTLRRQEEDRKRKSNIENLATTAGDLALRSTVNTTAPVFGYEINKPLPQIIAENKLIMQAAESGLRFIDEQLLAFYRQEGAFVQSLLNRSDVETGDSILLEEEMTNLDLLSRYITQFVWGYNGDVEKFRDVPEFQTNPKQFLMDREHACKNQMTKIHFHGFQEEATLEMLRSAFMPRMFSAEEEALQRVRRFPLPEFVGAMMKILP